MRWRRRGLIKPHPLHSQAAPTAHKPRPLALTHQSASSGDTEAQCMKTNGSVGVPPNPPPPRGYRPQFCPPTSPHTEGLQAPILPPNPPYPPRRGSRPQFCPPPPPWGSRGADAHRWDVVMVLALRDWVTWQALRSRDSRKSSKARAASGR